MERLKTAWSSHKGALPLAVVAVLVLAGFGVSIAYVAGVWAEEDSDWAERLEWVRNAAIVIGGVIALGLAYWRGRIADRQAAAADRQATAAQTQVDTALRQIEIAQAQVQAAQQQGQTALQGQLSQRYEKGSEMLGSEVLAVRMGGIYNLQRLADEDPLLYYIQVVDSLCAFTRNPPVETDVAQDNASRRQIRLRDDVQAVFDWLGYARQLVLEENQPSDYRLNLRGASLRGVVLAENSNLSRADLSGADLSAMQLVGGANFSQALLSGAQLQDANLTEANLSGAHLFGASCDRLQLENADVSAAQFSLRGTDPATGLTQRQLDEAIADPSRPPRLQGVRDAESGLELEWRGS